MISKNIKLVWTVVVVILFISIIYVFSYFFIPDRTHYRAPGSYCVNALFSAEIIKHDNFSVIVITNIGNTTISGYEIREYRMGEYQNNTRIASEFKQNESFDYNIINPLINTTFQVWTIHPDKRFGYLPCLRYDTVKEFVYE